MRAMISEVYEAFLEAGASPAKASKAAEAIAAYDNRFSKLERESADGFTRLERRMEQQFAAVDSRFTKLEGELNLQKWMSGFLLVGVGSLVVRTFFS